MPRRHGRPGLLTIRAIFVLLLAVLAACTAAGLTWAARRDAAEAEDSPTLGRNVLAKLIFFVVAAAAALGSAALAGLIAAVVGLSVQLPTATLITLTAGVATATFGAAVVLASMAASLFFNAPIPFSSNDSTATGRHPVEGSGDFRSSGPSSAGHVSADPGSEMP